MSIDDTSKVDAIGIERDTNRVVLTIADSWDWSNEPSHLLALQEKLNSYFRFIESGQLWESYPAANGKTVVIDVVTRFPLSAAGRELLEASSVVASQLAVEVRHMHCDDIE